MSERAWQALRSRQFLVYVTGGLLSAFVDIGSMGLLLRADFALVWATSIGFLSGLAVNYAFHARMTFAARSTFASVVKYLIIVAANYALTLAMVLASDDLIASPLIGKVVSLPVVAINGFLLSKFWVFR